jgi:hypothetical protein
MVWLFATLSEMCASDLAWAFIPEIAVVMEPKMDMP